MTPPRRRFAAVIGDVIHSRAFPDQRELLDTVFATLEWANTLVPAAQPLRPTAGDEFQGAYDSRSAALHVTLLLRLRLWERCDLRFGIGWGTISASRRTSAGQSGTAWWEARAAIDDVAGLDFGPKGFPVGIRTLWRGGGRESAALANAYLMCRDEILRRFDAKDSHIALGLLFGQSQGEIAGELSITQSSVSARQRGKGISALYHAHRSFISLLGSS